MAQKRRWTIRIKMRRTGNGTNARQWLYVLINIPMIWIVKIGITGNLSKRIRQIDRSAIGWDVPIFAVKIRFAYAVEQSIHRLCARLRVRFHGSGKTERFLVLAALPAILGAVIVFVLEWIFYLSIAAGFLYLVSMAGKT